MPTKPAPVAKRISIVYVEWGAEHRERSLGELLRSIPPSPSLELSEIVIVDNRRECVPSRPSLPVFCRVVPGSNASREFSGWDEGFQALTCGARAADVLVLCNDTFAVHRRPRLLRRRRLRAWIRHLAWSDRPEGAGQLDPLGRGPVDSPFGPMTTYLSTYVFALNRLAVEKAFPFSRLEPHIESLLCDSPSSRTLFAGAETTPYRRRLEQWLHEAGGWIRAAPLTPQNFGFLRLKAKSILYEHGLSGQLRKAHL